jgi:hypothetical protein
VLSVVKTWSTTGAVAILDRGRHPDVLLALSPELKRLCTVGATFALHPALYPKGVINISLSIYIYIYI